VLPGAGVHDDGEAVALLLDAGADSSPVRVVVPASLSVGLRWARLTSSVTDPPVDNWSVNQLCSERKTWPQPTFMSFPVLSHLMLSMVRS
jgi:hypothetical protein